MKIIKRLMEFSLAFFIIVTGTALFPTIVNTNIFFRIIYALSIILSSVYFATQFLMEKHHEKV